MARTKASVGAKVASAKSSKARCSAAPPPSSSSGSSGSSEKSSRFSSGGGNPVCPRETPVWQKPITSFFGRQSNTVDEKRSSTDDSLVPGPSKSQPRRNVIESDDEDDRTKLDPKPNNTILDDSTESEPITGEKCHKIEEYYQINGAQTDGDKEDSEKLKDTGDTIENRDTGDNIENSDIDDVDIVNGDDEKQNDSNKDEEIEENSGNDENEDIEMEIDETDKQNGIISKQSVTSDKQNGEVTNQKGKGRGKKTVNKENVHGNIVRRKSIKRDLEEIAFGEESEHISKKVKVL